MSKRLSLLLLLATFTPLAHADDASKAAKLQQFFEVTKVNQLPEQMGNQVLNQMNNQMKQQAASADLNAKQQKLVTDYAAKVNSVVKTQLTWDKVKDKFTTLYGNAYSEPEIDAILAFYKSPAGQTMLAKIPELNRQGLQIGQTQFESLVPQLRQMSQDFAREMSEAATKSPAGAPPATKPSPSPAPARP